MKVKWTMKTVEDRCEVVGDCWIWQQLTNSTGQPTASIEGKRNVMVRRWVYERHNKVKLGSLVVTSKCMQPLCCSPLCIVAKTKRELALMHAAHANPHATYTRRLRASIKGGGTRLNLEIVREIRKVKKPTASYYEETAARLGVSTKTVQSAHNGRSWKETPTASIFTMGAQP